MKFFGVIGVLVLVTAAATALSVLVGSATLSILFSVILIYEAGVVTFIAVWLLATAVVAMLLPPRARAAVRRRKSHFRWIMLVCIVFFAAAGKMVNTRYLPSVLHPASLVFDGALLVLTILLAWTLFRRTRARLLLFAVTSLAVLSFVVVVASMRPAASDGGAGHELETLAALPYVAWVPNNQDKDKSGVTYYDPERSYPGLNIYNSRDYPRAILMDMEGNFLHEWSSELHKDTGWMHVELMENGDLLAVAYRKAILLLDWDSNIKWVRDIPTHHDIALPGDGKIYVLTRSEEILPVWGIPLPMVDDQITVLSAAGDVLERISLHEMLAATNSFRQVRGIYTWLLRPSNLRSALRSARSGVNDFVANDDLDLYHSNTIEFVERDIDDAFKKGNVIYCARNISTVAVLDLDEKKVLWSYGPGELERPHHPTLLDNGHLLIFDNGYWRGHSRVIELDPATREIVWQYVADPPERFFSRTRGGNQRLANGNTLITNSDNGIAFEVTPDGETVWEFYNPIVAKERRGAMYRLMRITDPDRCLRLEMLSSRPAEPK